MAENIPELPPGFTLDIEPTKQGESSGMPTLPPGFTLDEQSGTVDSAATQERKLPTYIPSEQRPIDKSGGLGEYAIETAKNVPGSALELGKDMAGAVLHPIETAKGLASTVAGGVQKLIPGEQEQEQSFDAFVDHLSGRYGTLDDTLATIKEDPVGAAADISALFSGAGGVLRGTKIGGTIGKLGAATDPVLQSAKFAKKIAEKTPQYMSLARSPSSMYQSAVKFSTTLSDEKRAALARTALDSGIMPTSSGLDKLYRKIRDVDSDVSMLIDDAVVSGKKLNVNDLFKEFDKLEKDAMLSAKPKSKQAAIRGIEKQIKESMAEIDKTGYNPAEAQRLKQNVYKDIKEYYDKRLKEPLSVKAQKSVAKQAKLFLEEVIPEIKQLNKKDSEYISLIEALDRPVSRIANRDMIGIGTPIKGTTGAAVGTALGDPISGAIVGVGLGVLDHPLVKARLAIVLDKLEKKNVKISPGTRASLRAAYIDSEDDEVEPTK